jgi:hypothetical protein
VLGPKTVVPATVACADLPVTTAPTPQLHVAAPHAGDRHELAYRDDVVVLSGGTPQGLTAGQRFYTRRFQPAGAREGAARKGQGSIRTSGWLTVIAADEHSALARVDYACTAIYAGDYLEPYQEPALPDTVTPPGPTDFSQMGRVRLGSDRRESFGAGDILTLDWGASKGITPGTRVAFYRDRGDGTPLVELGAGIVIEVAPETSKVVVERARSTITNGDYAGLQQR